MDEIKKPPVASREEIQEFFEEEQRLEDEQKRQNVAEEGRKREPFSSADIERLIQSSNREFMDWWGRTTSPNIHEKDVIPGGWDGVKRGSSSSKGRKKKRKMPRPSEFWKLE